MGRENKEPKGRTKWKRKERKAREERKEEKSKEKGYRPIYPARPPRRFSRDRTTPMSMLHLLVSVLVASVIASSGHREPGHCGKHRSMARDEESPARYGPGSKSTPIAMAIAMATTRGNRARGVRHGRALRHEKRAGQVVLGRAPISIAGSIRM